MLRSSFSEDSEHFRAKSSIPSLIFLFFLFFNAEKAAIVLGSFCNKVGMKCSSEEGRLASLKIMEWKSSKRNATNVLL